MRIFAGSESIESETRGCVLTIGNFDGLHLGHRALLARVVERGRALGCPTALYTFEPHPRRVLYPDRSPPCLMPWEQLARGLQESGIDYLIREQFTPEFASLEAEAFLRQVIARRVEPAEILVGRDFHFGKGRQGSGDTLERLGPALGLRVEIIPQVSVEDTDVSSSLIRELLAEGEVERAARCLGRPYTIWGRVVRGQQRGRQLGFPTANLEPENELIPKSGVYATRVRIFEGDQPGAQEFPAATNIGTRPTFDATQILTEAHLIDYEGDLYGRRLALAFHARIRPEQRFSGPEELARQIAADVAAARQLLGSADGLG